VFPKRGGGIAHAAALQCAPSRRHGSLYEQRGVDSVVDSNELSAKTTRAGPWQQFRRPAPMNSIPGLSHNSSLLIFTLIAVIGLIVVIARFKVNSIVAIVLAALFIALASGMELAAIMKSFQEGVGSVLGSIAMILGLGNMLGKMMAESGGAERIAVTLIQRFGQSRAPWTMVVIAFLVGIPVFFQVGLVLLMPLVFIMSQKTRMPLLQIGIPLVSGLSVMHGLVPPHPGPMVAIEILKADIGRIIFYSLLIGTPTAILAGPILGKILARRIPLETSGELAAQFTEKLKEKNLPGFAITVFTILLPVLLMLLATVVDLAFPKTSGFRQLVDFIGHPIVALLIAVLFSFYSLGYARGFKRQQILTFTNDCLAPIAGVILIIGAGGGFKEILVDSGVGAAIAERVSQWHLSPLLFAWLVAALIRIATGSATVAITTAAGIVAPIVGSIPGVNLELLVVAMGAGSLILSHVNDGGFWLVKEYFNMTVMQTLKTWTVMETIISVVALVFTLLLDAIIG
jgi:GntP family gluconate:H+ symporter